MMMKKEKEMNHDTFHGNAPRAYTTKDLVDQLFANLRDLAGNTDKNAYLAGYLSACLGDIAEKGVDELTAIVDFTNQQIEAREYNKRADARRQAWVDKEFA
jgi:hypothetical protein